MAKPPAFDVIIIITYYLPDVYHRRLKSLLFLLNYEGERGDCVQFDNFAVGKAIRTLRKEKGISQDVLSGFAGIARTHLTMIENGTNVMRATSFVISIDEKKQRNTRISLS